MNILHRCLHYNHSVYDTLRSKLVVAHLGSETRSEDISIIQCEEHYNFVQFRSGRQKQWRLIEMSKTRAV